MKFLFKEYLSQRLLEIPNRMKDKYITVVLFKGTAKAVQRLYSGTFGLDMRYDDKFKGLSKAGL